MRQRPNLIILDIDMPRMNGVALLKKIRHLDRNIPVIMLTGNADLTVAARTLKEGASSYAPKPLNFKYLAGIPPDRLRQIWEAFYTTKAEGTGLGLSIVRGLAEQQPDATIDVGSAVGQGTTFTITMRTPSRGTSSVTT